METPEANETGNQEEENTGDEHAGNQEEENTGDEHAGNQEEENTGDEISDEHRERVIKDAIEAGTVVDYETRFKPIYGALKHAERELATNKTGKALATDESKTLSGSPKPVSTDFENYDEYNEAVTDWKLEQRDIKRNEDRAKISQQESERQWDDQVTKELAKDPEFLEKGYIPEGLVPMLAGTKHLIDFAYFFAKKPAEAQRLMGLSQIMAAREIGQLEESFKKIPTAQKINTKAPAKTKPVGNKTTGIKKPEDMDPKEYRDWRENGGGSE